MAYDANNLSQLAYANGFTLWQYTTTVSGEEQLVPVTLAKVILAILMAIPSKSFREVARNLGIEGDENEACENGYRQSGLLSWLCPFF